MNAKSIIGQTTHMATMCAFAIPGCGAAIAAGIAVVSGFLNLLMPSLQENTPSGMQSLNKQDLQNAIDELKDTVADALFDEDVDNATTEIYTFYNDTLLLNIEKAQNLGLNKNASWFAKDHTTTVTRTTLDTFFAPDLDKLDSVVTKRDVLTRSSANNKNLSSSSLAAHRTNTTTLYCFAGSTIVLYLKTAIAWNWAQEIIHCNAYVDWLAAKKAWGGKNAAYKQIHPDQDPDLLYPGVGQESAALPLWQDWCASSKQLDLIERNIREICSYSIRNEETDEDGLYTVMAGNWQSRIENLVAIVVNYNELLREDLDSIADQQDPFSTGFLDIRDRCEVWRTVCQGIELVDSYDRDTTQFSLGEVTYQQLVLYHDSLGLWQDSLATLRFRTFIAGDNDTPRTIAARTDVYNDASLYTKLLDPHEAPYQNGDMNLSGETVKAPDLKIDRVEVPELPIRHKDPISSF